MSSQLIPLVDGSVPQVPLSALLSEEEFVLSARASAIFSTVCKPLCYRNNNKAKETAGGSLRLLSLTSNQKKIKQLNYGNFPQNNKNKFPTVIKRRPVTEKAKN